MVCYSKMGSVKRFFCHVYFLLMLELKFHISDLVVEPHLAV